MEGSKRDGVSFTRLRMRARCSMLSKVSGVGRLVGRTISGNRPTLTVASRNGEFNIGRFISAMTGVGTPLGPVVKYRICITGKDECRHGNERRGG